MWKFHEVSIIQILREISFGESRSSKNAVFPISGALNFVNFQPSTSQKNNVYQNSEPLDGRF